MDFAKIDKNFKVDATIDKQGLCFYDPREAPFKIYGIYYEEGRFRRLPEGVAKATNNGVWGLHANTAGGRLRFRTDSQKIAIQTAQERFNKSDHFALTASAGFDLYLDHTYYNTFRPPYTLENGFESLIPIKEEKKMREILIHFPLYSDVLKFSIGLEEGAKIEAPTPYREGAPLVYYGSSITQGGCASRPGNAYENILSRRLNVDHINLGFSGNAKGEQAVTDYIAGLEMRAFIMDYDHNAPTPEHLEATHEKMFLAIREKQPDLPILILSAPIWAPDEKWTRRREIVCRTYERAVARGDRNVYFISGKELMALAKEEGTVDNCHPTDFGFYSMADGLEATIRKMIGE